MDKETYKRLYNVWSHMKRRCYDPHCISYKNYGKKGITVCDEWLHSFRPFSSWALSNGYSIGLTIDRIDNSMGYSPDNCRWATVKEQNRNYSRNHKLTYKGQTKCVMEWSEEYGIKAATILERIRNGWTPEEIFTIPLRMGVQRHVNKISRLQEELIRCRKELCLKCKNGIEGPECSGCRYRKDGEWIADIDNISGGG